MYEHPYLSYRATQLEVEQIERAAERRRFIAEHADQIVRRPESAWRRIVRRIARTAAAPDASSRSERRSSAPCEPAPAR